MAIIKAYRAVLHGVTRALLGTHGDVMYSYSCSPMYACIHVYASGLLATVGQRETAHGCASMFRADRTASDHKAALL